MQDFENIIPFLRKEYEQEVLQNESYSNELFEELSLLEDKIPAPLAKAYKRAWNPRETMASEVQSGYGDVGAFPQHDILNAYDAMGSRRSIGWDFGKAHYNKLTKQEAVDLLGMKIYKGRGRNKEEISINDPIPDAINQENPEKLTIEFEGNKAKENINKLRFLIQEDKDDWRLTEFEYRSTDAKGNDVEQFFPIYRDYFSSSKAKDLGIDTRDGGYQGLRVKDFKSWNSAKTVYYVIKLSDLIYETDEYDHYIGVGHNEKSSNIINNTADTLAAKIKNLFALSIADKYINQIGNKFNLDVKELMQKALDDGRFYYSSQRIAAQILSSGDVSDLDSNSDIDTIATLLDKYPDLPRSAAKELANSAMSEFLPMLNQTQKDWYNNNLKELFEADLNSLDTINARDLAYELQDKALADMPAGRKKDILTRRTQNSRKRIIRTAKPADDNANNNANGNGVEFTPYDKYIKSTEHQETVDVPDTGVHIKNAHWFDSKWVGGNSSQEHRLSNILRYYYDALKSVSQYKNSYIRAINNYNQVKKQAKYFNNDELEQELELAKNRYINAKARYLGGVDADGETQEGVLPRLQKYKKQLILSCDADAYKTTNLFTSQLNYLQVAYKKLLKLRQLVKDIGSYREEDFKKLYGFENKEEFERLAIKLETLAREQEFRLDRINKAKRKIEELQEQLKMLTTQVGTEESDFDKVAKEIGELEQAKDKLNTGIEDSIKKAYKDQAEFKQLATNIDNDIRKHKAGLKGKDLADIDPAKKQADERLQQLIREFTAEVPKLPEEQPDDDDILTDIDDIPVNNADLNADRAQA